MIKVRQRHHLIPSRYIDDQRIKSNWTRGTLDIARLKVFLSDTAFPWLPSHSKNLRYWVISSMDNVDQRILSLTGREAHLATFNQSNSLTYYLPLMTITCKKKKKKKMIDLLINFFKWYCWTNTWSNVVISLTILSSGVSPCRKSEISINFFLGYQWSKKSVNWLNAQLAILNQKW